MMDTEIHLTYPVEERTVMALERIATSLEQLTVIFLEDRTKVHGADFLTEDCTDYRHPLE